MIPSPDAVYDSLAIVKQVSQVSGGVTETEVSLFAYLACLLSVYRGEPPAEWGYSFSATHSSAPFSEDLAAAVNELTNSALLVKNEMGRALSEQGDSELESLGLLNRFSARDPFLEGACSSALFMPLPTVGESITAEPSLRRALELSSKRALLEEGGRQALMAHFDALAEVVPEARDLTIPAVVWLEYLASTLDTNKTYAVETAISAGDKGCDACS